MVLCVLRDVRDGHEHIRHASASVVEDAALQRLASFEQERPFHHLARANDRAPDLVLFRDVELGPHVVRVRDHELELDLVADRAESELPLAIGVEAEHLVTTPRHLPHAGTEFLRHPPLGGCHRRELEPGLTDRGRLPHPTRRRRGALLQEDGDLGALHRQVGLLVEDGPLEAPRLGKDDADALLGSLHGRQGRGVPLVPCCHHPDGIAGVRGDAEATALVRSGLGRRPVSDPHDVRRVEILRALLLAVGQPLARVERDEEDHRVGNAVSLLVHHDAAEHAAPRELDGGKRGLGRKLTLGELEDDLLGWHGAARQEEEPDGHDGDHQSHDGEDLQEESHGVPRAQDGAPSFRPLAILRPIFHSTARSGTAARPIGRGSPADLA